MAHAEFRNKIMAKKKYYAVAKGRIPGIYDKWQGENGAEAQIVKFPDAFHKGFTSLDDAEKWFEEVRDSKLETQHLKFETQSSDIKAEKPASEADTEKSELIIYTDGGCVNNPGPGGYGVVLIYGKHRKKLSGGFRLTTNNRMELMASIEALKALKRRCCISLHSDSSYVVNGIEKGWAERWRRNNWMRNKTEHAENADLWEQLLDLCEAHDVRFVWVRGHAGNRENERCDQLAGHAAKQKNLPADEAYENGETKKIATEDTEKRSSPGPVRIAKSEPPGDLPIRQVGFFD